MHFRFFEAHSRVFLHFPSIFRSKSDEEIRGQASATFDFYNHDSLPSIWKNGTSDSFVRASSSKENSSNELGDVPRKNYAHVPPSNLKTDAIPLPSLSLLVEERIAPRNEERKEGRKKGKKNKSKGKGGKGKEKAET